MNTHQRKAIRFLKAYQMDIADVSVEETLDAFLAQMQKGLAGQKSSLAMIPTYLSLQADVPCGRRVIVADAGGTNFRVATVHFDDRRNAVIEHLRVFKMPGVERELNRAEFFAAMAGYFTSVIDAADNIGFCFSYPVEMMPDKDGRMIHFSKEVKVRGVTGQLVGKGLNEAFAAAKMPAGKHIVLLNDTVATLLAGCGHHNRVFGGMIGFILGTGTNCAYVERNAAVKKVKGLDPAGAQIINIESGGMAKCRRGLLDKQFDKTTATPGFYQFEKMIAGAYLGPLYGYVLAAACKDGLFSKRAAASLKSLEPITTKTMNTFLLHPYGDNPLARACAADDESDTQTAFVLADRLTERAAKLTAINLAAAVIKSGQGGDPTRPVGIVADGTTFYQMRSLKPRVEFYLKQILENKRGLYTEIITVENAPIIGAAIAGLTN